MPELLQLLLALDYEYDDGEGMDFEPYDEFMSYEDATSWFRAWTGNQDVDGAFFQIFGQDGTGGYAALWTVRPGRDLLEQPVVFFGSEGAVGVVASSVYDYLWLLAGGLGPMEAVEYPNFDRPENEEFLAFAEEHAADHRATAQEVLARAKAEFPSFVPTIRALSGL